MIYFKQKNSISKLLLQIQKMLQEEFYKIHVCDIMQLLRINCKNQDPLYLQGCHYNNTLPLIYD